MVGVVRTMNEIIFFTYLSVAINAFLFVILRVVIPRHERSLFTHIFLGCFATVSFVFGTLAVIARLMSESFVVEEVIFFAVTAIFWLVTAIRDFKNNLLPED